MSFFGKFFHGARATSVVFIDISADSVAGAYTCYRDGTSPALLYTRRFPIEVRKDEPRGRAMFRALELLGSTLVHEGAPILMRTIGTGRADTILVSIDAPWQKTTVRTEHFEKKTPFVFTKSMVATALEKTATAPTGTLLADESIIGTILNGYETRNPYGKRVCRAAVIVLTSFINKEVVSGIAAFFRKLHHTARVLFISGSSLRYQAMLKLFPHERDALIFDAAGSLTSIALVRKGLLVSVIEVPSQYTSDTWVADVGIQLAELGKNYPLPRTIFLVARESEAAALQKKLDEAHLAKLWLSDNPPKIVAVLPSHLAGSVRQTTTAPPDLQLLLMTLFGQDRPFEGDTDTHRSSLFIR